MIDAHDDFDDRERKHVVLVTGASGMVGHAVVQHIAEHKPNWQVVASVRSTAPTFPPKVKVLAGLNLQPDQDWSEALAHVTDVVHCAARVHIMREPLQDAEVAYQDINVRGTLNLARQAAKAGIGRFVFLSSIKVNGEKTSCEKPFKATDMPDPQDAYGRSKADAERELLALGKSTGMDIVIIRPPLVYGSGVKANFAQMVKLVKKGWPLPLLSINNRRSLVALPNLVDLIVCCIKHRSALHQVFLVSDNNDVSTPELFRLTALATRQKSRLFGFPPLLLRLGGALVGRTAIADRLCDSLQVDIGATRDMLGWSPEVTMKEALKATVDNMS
jgi:nucleoside-diphosphate-sugar epimerase